MHDTANAARMRRLFDEAWTGGDTAVVQEVVDDSFVFSRGGTSQEGGPGLYEDLIHHTREMFPDMAFALDDVIVGDGGDVVTVRWTMTGTHEGEYMGIEPTGKSIEMEGLEINWFEDGNLVETCTHPHWEGFLEEVGVLPVEES